MGKRRDYQTARRHATSVKVTCVGVIRRRDAYARSRDRELVLRLFEADLRALGIQPKIRAEWLRQAAKEYGGPHEPGGLCAIRAIIAVLDGFPVERVKRGFSESMLPHA